MNRFTALLAVALLTIAPALAGTFVGSSGSGTITSSSSGQCAVFTAATTVAGSANCMVTIGALTLGASGTLGPVQMGNATSGTVKIQSVTGALGSVTASLPANTGTIAETNLAQAFTAQQNFSPIATITDASTIAWDLSSAQGGTVTIASTGRTLTPSNVVSGGTYILYTVQGSGGSKTITTYTNIQWPGGTTPTLSTAAGAVDMISCASNDGTHLQCVFSGNFS